MLSSTLELLRVPTTNHTCRTRRPCHLNALYLTCCPSVQAFMRLTVSILDLVVFFPAAAVLASRYMKKIVVLPHLLQGMYTKHSARQESRLRAAMYYTCICLLSCGCTCFSACCTVLLFIVDVSALKPAQTRQCLHLRLSHQVNVAIHPDTALLRLNALVVICLLFRRRSPLSLYILFYTVVYYRGVILAAYDCSLVTHYASSRPYHMLHLSHVNA